MNSRVKLFIPVAVFAIMAVLLFSGLRHDPNAVSSALLNKPFPEFSQPGLFDTDRIFTRADLAGKVLIVNVWGSWCPPCHEEHPLLLDVSEKEPDVTFVGITYDYSMEEDRAFLEEKGSPFDLDIVDLDGSLRIDLGTTGAPETFVVDKNGTILYRHVGAITNTVWENTFVPLLDQIR